VPVPVPQRMLPSLNREQTRPDLQSSFVVHVSHSPPLLHPARGRMASASDANQRDLRERLIRFELLNRQTFLLNLNGAGARWGSGKSQKSLNLTLSPGPCTLIVLASRRRF
jgi:hypothetical protein